MKIKDAEEWREKFHKYFETMPLSTLRILGRKYGAAQACSTHKEELIGSICDILLGEVDPVPRSKRGAPAKMTYVDPAVIAQIDRMCTEMRGPERFFEVASPEPSQRADSYDCSVNTGILEITAAGYGFVRAHNCQPSADGDVFIPAPMIHAMKLRQGDYIACTVKPRQKSDSPAIGELLSVNGAMIGQYENRPNFDALTAQYAREKIAFSENESDLSLRVLDLFAPIGKGQRALIIAPPKAGKTTLLKSIASSIAKNHREITLIVLLIDERPEEVTDFRMSVSEANVVYSTFDEGPEHHIRAAELTLDHAKRIAERGKDVVILLDSLTKLTRAYNNTVASTGKTLTGGLDAAAFAEPKRFFGAARNTVEAGSLTILATALVETGSRMDDVIYEEFKGTGNSDIFLSRELAEKRIFPAIDIRRSGTRKEELLLTEEELSAVYKMRERGLTENMAGLLDMLRRTPDNANFVSRLPEWLRVYKNI